MKRSKAIEYRRRIEAAAALQDDEAALESVWMFPEWVIGENYAVGERIRYGGVLYRCEQAHVSQEGWEPPAVRALWTPVSVDEYPEWIQPTGAQDAYSAGDKVTHNGKRWVSDTDANIWEPGVYGWTEVTA